ncbi:MAG: N-acyl homoserine lactonase family protein [Myxococcota bacterium]
MVLARLPTVHRLLLAEMTCPDFHPTPGDEVEVYAYLIEHPEGAVLVDSGMGSDNAFLNRAYRPRLVPLSEALGEAGCRISDVVALVNSHLHFDHCGNNRRLLGVPTWVQRKEVEAAREPHYTIREWFDFDGAALRMADGEMEVLPGVRLIPTPGHTPGHQSVLVEGGKQRVLIGAQAAYRLEEWRAGADPPVNSQPGLEERYRATFEGLQRLGADAVYLSHDSRTARD